MKYAVVYSSRTGNTKKLANAVRDALPAEECIYWGEPSTYALKAQRIYVGFWTDKGTCNRETADFLKGLTGQEVFLFGTAGFGENQEYFEKILKRTAKYIPKQAHLIGTFMCQGKMPLSVRQRYEKMQNSAVKIPNLEGLSENFDCALSHPDEKDLDALKKSVSI